jgi:hypothetical protein
LVYKRKKRVLLQVDQSAVIAVVIVDLVAVVTVAVIAVVVVQSNLINDICKGDPPVLFFFLKLLEKQSQ